MGTFALDLKPKAKKSSKKKRSNVFGDTTQNKKKTKIKLTHVDEHRDELEEKLVIKPEQLKSSFYDDSNSKNCPEKDVNPSIDTEPKFGLVMMKDEQEGTADERKMISRGDNTALPEITKEEEYEKVPVEEFGEALLRGMGWNGQDEQITDDKKQGKSIPRPQFLGIGAKALPKRGVGAKIDSKEASFMPVVKISKQSGKRLE